MFSGGSDMRVRRTLSAAIVAGGLVLTLVPAASASSPSCTAQFVSVLAPQVVPLGQQIVVPEVQNLTLGGPNLGLEVKDLLATADKNACPVTP
jgi:hypothetical protein